jgi:hypothetical protein
MHRTTLSIAAENTIGGLDAAVPILKDSAFIDLVTISNLINAHVDTVGLQSVKTKIAPNGVRGNQDAAGIARCTLRLSDFCRASIWTPRWRHS